MLRQYPEKKFAMAIGAGLLAAAMLAPAAISPAYAGNNHGDSDYGSYINYNSVSYTDARGKWDDSSSWDACESGPNHKVEVFASNTNWSPTYVGSKQYYFGRGASGHLSNWVYERGYPKALLWFSEPNYSGTIKGVWSPDSV